MCNVKKYKFKCTKNTKIHKCAVFKGFERCLRLSKVNVLYNFLLQNYQNISLTIVCKL